MTRRPDADEHIVLGERSGWAKGERFFLKDLAAYLHQSNRTIRAWGRKQGLVKHLPLKANGYGGGIDYFTRYGAMRVIAHFRAQQGEQYLAGKDYHERKDKLAASRKRQKLLK